MTTLHERTTGEKGIKAQAKFQVMTEPSGAERREFRRHDLEQQGLTIDRWDGSRRSGKLLGQIVDLSAGGVRIRSERTDVRADQQVRVRIELPTYAGISPFIDRSHNAAAPKREWVGWMAVARVMKLDEKTVDVAGRLVDMDEMDRGMLGLYLSTQPLAA
jgi:hypothetical protein